MKSIKILPLAAMVLGFAGCATSPTVVAPVGPNPAGSAGAGSTGGLQVFSRMVERSDDHNQGGSDNPVWYQHADYNIYNSHGKRIRHVFNAVGFYATTPPIIQLPPGQYVVTTKARDAAWVRVPVEIERGRTSRIHLDDNWKAPAGAPGNEVVSLPSGGEVGWLAGHDRN